jgi:hypothetical protein
MYSSSQQGIPHKQCTVAVSGTLIGRSTAEIGFRPFLPPNSKITTSQKLGSIDEDDLVVYYGAMI